MTFGPRKDCSPRQATTAGERNDLRRSETTSGRQDVLEDPANCLLSWSSMASRVDGLAGRLVDWQTGSRRSRPLNTSTGGISVLRLTSSASRTAELPRRLAHSELAT